MSKDPEAPDFPNLVECKIVDPSATLGGVFGSMLSANNPERRAVEIKAIAPKVGEIALKAAFSSMDNQETVGGDSGIIATGATIPGGEPVQVFFELGNDYSAKSGVVYFSESPHGEGRDDFVL